MHSLPDNIYYYMKALKYFILTYCADSFWLLQFNEDCNTEKKIAAKLESSAVKALWLDKEDMIRRVLFDLQKVDCPVMAWSN